MKKSILFSVLIVGATLLQAQSITVHQTCGQNGQVVKAIPPEAAQAVDLGLSVKWANMNVGATTPEGYGDYFAWGETSTKETYNVDTYFDTNDRGSTFTKYNNEGGKTILDPEDDAAHVNWGGSWRMPTKAEWQELLDNCTWTWTTQNGINGYKVTSNKAGYTDKFIFLPAAGYRNGSDLSNVGSYGGYGSSSLYEYYSNRAWHLAFGAGSRDLYGDYRYSGQSVRSVLQPSSISYSSSANDTIRIYSNGCDDYQTFIGSHGSQLTMTANSDQWSHFVRWQDGNTDNPRTIWLSQDTTFTAEFAKNTYSISTTSANPEWGTTAGGKSALYLDEIEISAIPNYGYHFTQWSDGNTDNPRTIVLTQDTTFTAEFAKNIYSITKGTDLGKGSIFGPSSAEYLDNVTLEVVPNYGYHFTQWSDGVKDNPRTIVLTQDTTFTAEFADLLVEKKLPGYFSVGHGKTVKFSQGNLQYRASDNSWKFANEQYDVVSWGQNEQLSQTCYQWIDLFKFASSGYNGFYPWADTIYNTSESITNTNYDWGVYNPIINGKNQAGMWRTLTISEWYYLFNERTNASSLFGFACINGINGLIVLPDEFDVSTFGINTNHNAYSNNVLTIEQWQAYETSGAIFLPTNGRIPLGDISSSETDGFYWSSTAADGCNGGYAIVGAYAWFFNGHENRATDPDWMQDRRSVRLVRDTTVIVNPVAIGDLYYNLDIETQTAAVTSMPTGKYSGSIIIPESVEYNSVTYNVTSIEDHAFIDCSSLTSITIPNSVTSIGEWAFAASGLSTIYIPNSVSNIAIAAFSCCPNMTNIVVDADNPTYDSRNNCNAIIETATNTIITGCKTTSLPDDVVCIGARAFASCGLTSLVIPNGVTKIEHDAFAGCSELSSIVLPNSLATIDYGAFWNCSMLTSVIIPRNVTSIEHEAFANCYSLNEMIVLNPIPAHIGEDVLGYTNNTNTWTSVYVPCGTLEDYQTQWSAYSSNIKYRPVIVDAQVNIIEAGYVIVPTTICDSLMWAIVNNGYRFVQWSDGVMDNPRTIKVTQDTTFTAEFAYDRVGTCGKDFALTWSYDPTNKVLTIGNAGSFTENMQFGAEAPNEMEELVIGNSVTAIGENAFAGISTLKKVTIGEAVKTIYDRAFYNCVNLETIFNYRPTPTNAYSTAFDGVDKFACSLYVLPSSIDMYKAAAVWQNFYYTYAIGAEEATVLTNDVKVEPQDNAATVTWPTSENAATYTIEITKDGVVFCTLIFNGNGQLTGIAFAPGKNGNHHAPAAKMTANGLQFTVTGLNSATHYALTLQAKDDQNAVLASYSSEFTTTGTATAIDNTPFPSGEGRGEASKILRDGKMYIIRGEKTYTITGQEVK